MKRDSTFSPPIRMSFLWKGYNLEHKLGGPRFLATVAFLLVLSHALVVLVALALASLFHEQVGTAADC